MSDDGQSQAPVAGPSVPAHLLQRSSTAPIGPTLPTHMRVDADRVDDKHDISTPRRILGPTMPPTADEQGAKLSTGAQAFLDREKRMKEAAEREAAGLAPKSQETNGSSRPDWMMAPPTAQSFSETLQKDQSAALKNRGFSQAGNARVQKGRGGGPMGGMDEEDSSLWTETPQERAQRLKEEELGVRPKGSDGRQRETEEEREKKRADRDREEKLQQAIREHEAQRGPSLLEQHQSKRRDELKLKNGHHKEAKDDGSRSRKKRSGSESESDDSRHAHRSHSRRDRKDEDRHRSRRHRRDKDTESDSSSEDDSRRRREKEKDRSRSDTRVKSDRDPHHKSSHRSHHDQSRDKEKEERRRKKERERERKEKRREREQEEKGEKKGASTMIWDREAAMSVGGKLLDNQKRMETIRSAAGLGSRFGSGTARYL